MSLAPGRLKSIEQLVDLQGRLGHRPLYPNRRAWEGPGGRPDGAAGFFPREHPPAVVPALAEDPAGQ